MPPSAPEVEVEYSTSNSIKVKWTKPENGGSTIQGKFLLTYLAVTRYLISFNQFLLLPNHTVRSIIHLFRAGITLPKGTVQKLESDCIGDLHQADKNK